MTHVHHKYFRLVKRKEKNVLTFFGWLVLISCLVLFFLVFIRNIHGFLAKNEPVESKILVIEGWISDYATLQAIDKFRNDNYDLIISIGCELEKGYYLSKYKSTGELTKQSLTAMGVSSDSIVGVNVGQIHKDRTYMTAQKLKMWINQQRPDIKDFNIYTMGTHARRSHILYRMAFGETYNIGIISYESISYDNKKWWNSSKGFKTVITELISFVYTCLFFHPE